MATNPSTEEPGKKKWIDHWEPEDEDFWEHTGKKIANRNLWFSIFAEHIGFSVWTLWSVLVLFMGPDYGFSAADKFLLVSTPTLVGSILRLPYTLAVARFGGRDWTIISAGLLLVPTILAAIVMRPGVPLWVFLLVAAVGGVGGGNFASSMTNINTFYPQRRKGWALGLNAGGGNLGVAVIQLVGLLMLSTAGAAAPQLVLWVYIPLIVLACLGAVRYMDNISSVRNDRGAMREVVMQRQAWVMSFLYIGTFGSFIGYSFAFALVLQNQFHRTPVQAAAVTFLGPLLGSLSRPLGGKLADTIGGAKVTLVTFLLMAAGAGLTLVASSMQSLSLYTAGFVVLFVLSGIGNGSTYKMIPAIFRTKAALAVAEGAPEQPEVLKARRLSGALIGVAGAVGALGGLFINLAFRASFQSFGSGDVAVYAFLAFYLVCGVTTWAVYLRGEFARSSEQFTLARAGV
ncbi:NarK/NasA family nitrate transporter [Saccharopolyspora sp. K220]|uniref:nitrate/nitrite transporter n=1 Tax=Saccharopolyspora soli TaxID=2926618 RepID=UPI001F58695C|nr:nitrate/nitrite transporter [Saccharopolyspora soli]MCI2419941.1 NarK/NasA family nitrate transporter [Saccharopolyspora soli]